jgi:hypothetical protein
MGEYNISSGHMTFAKASNKLDFSNILLSQIRLIAPNKISLGIFIFPISFPPRPFPCPSATPAKIFVMSLYPDLILRALIRLFSLI